MSNWFKVMEIAMSDDGQVRLKIVGAVPGQGGWDGYGYNNFVFATMADALAVAKSIARDETPTWKTKIAERVDRESKK